jgi:hypothetical protein
MSVIHVLEIRMLALRARRHADLTTSQYLEISFDIGGYYTPTDSYTDRPDPLRLMTNAGPMTMFLERKDYVSTIVLSMNDEYFDPKAIDQYVVMPSVSISDIRDHLFSSGRLRQPDCIDISFASEVSEMRIDKEMITFGCPYGLITMDVTSSGKVSSIEIC